VCFLDEKVAAIKEKMGRYDAKLAESTYLFPFDAASLAWHEPLRCIFTCDGFLDCFAQIVFGRIRVWCHCIVDPAVIRKFVFFVEQERVGCADCTVCFGDVLCLVE